MPMKTLSTQAQLELMGVRISHPDRVIDAATGLTKGKLAARDLKQRTENLGLESFRNDKEPS